MGLRAPQRSPQKALETAAAVIANGTNEISLAAVADLPGIASPSVKLAMPSGLSAAERTEPKNHWAVIETKGGL